MSIEKETIGTTNLTVTEEKLVETIMTTTALPDTDFGITCKDNSSCITHIKASHTVSAKGLEFMEKIWNKYVVSHSLSLEGIELLMKNLKISEGKRMKDVAIFHDDLDDHDSNDYDFDHEMKEDGLLEGMSYDGDNFMDNIEFDKAKCLKNVSDLLKEYYPGYEDGRINISKSELFFVLPRLIYDLQLTECFSTDSQEHHSHHHEFKDDSDRGKVWGIALGSVAIISLLSVIGIMIVPLMGHSSYFQRLLAFLVALAVGTLVGDALLHLLPHALGGHEHNHGDREEDEESTTDERSKIIKSLVAVLGIYTFFVFESTMMMIRKRKAKRRYRASIDSTPKLMVPIPEKRVDDFLTLAKSDTEVGLLVHSPDNASSRGDDVIIKSTDSGISSTNTIGYSKLSSNSSANSLKPMTNDNAENKTPPFPLKFNISDDEEELNCETKIAGVDEQLHTRNHDDGHHHHHHGDIANAQGIKDMAWMIIAGDGLHNFSDGLAIGAAFSSSVSAGLSTSLAIFCHELPHELGDFAILIDAGMSIKRALLYNGLCACLAFLGAIIGILIGEYTTTVKLWILAVTAGGFLYVGLVDMLPQMLRQCVEKDGFNRFIYQNVGFLLGVVIMLLIACYEESFMYIFYVER